MKGRTKMNNRPPSNQSANCQRGIKSGEEERRVLQSRDLYQELYELAPIGYFIVNTDTTILDLNRKGAILFNTTREKLLGTKLTALVTTSFENILDLCKTNRLESNEWRKCELEMVKPDGSQFFAVFQARQLADPKEIVLFVTDITQHRRTENALKESEKKYREVADRLAEGVFEADSSGTVTYANHKVLSSLGLSEDDLKNGFNVLDVIAPQNLSLARERLGKVLRQEDIGAGEYMLARKDGTTFPALVHSLAIVRDEKVVGVRGILVDISERKQAETALQESERKYRELAELLGSGVFEADTNGTLTYANRKGLALFGFSENDLKKGLNVIDVIMPRDIEAARKNFGRVLKQEDIGPIEYLLRRKDGATFPALTYSTAILLENVVTGVRGVVVDISELKRAEHALKESERKYRELTDLLDEGIFEMDLKGRFTYANRKGLSSLGIDENDLKKGLSIFDIIAPQDLELAREKLAGTLNREDTGAVEFLIVRKDGTTFPALTHGSAIERDGVVAGMRGIVFDISELKKTEQALRKSEERFRTLLKSLHEGIWVLDKDDLTTFVNPRMAEMLSYTEEEMLGKSVYSFTHIDDEWQNKTADYMVRRKQGISEQIEYELLRKDGEVVYALLETSPILDENDNYTGSIAGVQDITERKLAEERLKQAMGELDRSNKELEQFAYVTSHDLREPLRMMTSFSQSLEKRYKGKLDQTADEYINFIVDGAARMQKLIDDILFFSRVTTRALPFESVGMEKILQDTLENLRASIEKTKAKITHEKLPVVQADPSQMIQVMQNLIGNAIKFHKNDELPAVHISAALEGREWIFSVKDNGIGIDPELFDRVFNLFQRLHPQNKYPGTGVGLAVAKKIVQRHGGRIWVESQPDQGSTFYFSIPREQRRD
jgi:PAS domain S-box-containing protein